MCYIMLYLFIEDDSYKCDDACHMATSTWSVQRNTENCKRFPAGFWAAMYYIWTIYTWKAIIPLFLSNSLDHFFLLRLWLFGATCVRVATAFYGLFSTKCRKNTVLLRVGLSCFLIRPCFLSLRVKTCKNYILQKNMIITVLFPIMTKQMCFWFSK